MSRRSASKTHRSRISDDEPRLVARMHELVREHPRYGHRRIHALLRREGWRVNRGHLVEVFPTPRGRIGGACVSAKN
jgi:transposase InsO family protein